MKKLVLIISSLILCSCCDSIDCSYLWLPNKFWEGAVILLYFVVIISLLSSVIYNIKNKNKMFNKFWEEEYVWIFPCILIILIIVWAIVYFGFNGVVLLKYLGVA